MWGKATGRKEQRGKDHRSTGRKPHGPVGEEAQPRDRDAACPQGDSKWPPPSPRRGAAAGLTPQGTDRHRAAGRYSGTASAGRWPPTSESQAIPGAPAGPVGHPVTQEGAWRRSMSKEQRHPGDCGKTSWAGDSWLVAFIP